jgi:predicted nucleic acid-binding protein
MILVDTNVLSEPMKPRPDPTVMTWLNLQRWDELFLCTPVLAELRYGCERLAAGRRRDSLAQAIDRIENELYRGRILTFDQTAAAHYAHPAARRDRQGRRIELMDALIASIALAHNAMIATRDIEAFAGLGIELVNPFDVR